MKVYLATRGEYSDYRVCHVFAREEDARNYPLGDDVQEREVKDGPVEVRSRHYLTWNPGIADRTTDTHRLANPYVYTSDEDFDGDDRHASHQWRQQPLGPVLQVEGWDRDRVMRVYSEQRAKHLAQRSE